MKPVKRTFNGLFPTFDNLWNDFFSDDFMIADRQRPANTMPAVNVKEDDTQYTLEVAAPGMNREDFHVEVNHNVLTISSQQEEKQEEQGNNGNYTRREFRYSTFSRSFTLPETVEHEQINARYDSGVLHVTLPKREEARTKAPRTIEIG